MKANPEPMNQRTANRFFDCLFETSMVTSLTTPTTLIAQDGSAQ